MRRVQHNQAFCHGGITNGEVPCQHAAPIMAHDDCFLGSQALYESGNIQQQRRYIVALAWLIAIVVAAQVRRDHPVTMLRQRGNLKAPRVPELREAMQQYDQWPFTLRHVMHTDAVCDDVAMLPRFYCDHVCLSCESDQGGDKPGP